MPASRPAGARRKADPAALPHGDAGTGSLALYRARRDFNQTREPAGSAVSGAAASALRFVIQRHHATRLHYDFRLEWKGVLLSWAVPKGPSLDPEVKRLAMQTEDHPLEYARFEGRIPHGHYGAGEVAIWDRGTWAPLDDMDKALARGRLHFRLQGERLGGDWLLVRSRRERGNEWLLRKLDDAHVVKGYDAEAPENQLSVPAPRVTARAGKSPTAAAFPEIPSPQLATLVDRPPQGEGWVFELKYDGYRMLCSVREGVPRLWSRNGLEWTSRLPELLTDIARHCLPDCWLDGEIVFENAKGISDFSALQAALSGDTSRIRYRVFDVLYYAGEDLRGLPLSRRLDALDDIFRKPMPSRLLATQRVSHEGGLALQEACRLGLEGLIGKRLDAPYATGRNTNWIKLKCRQRMEVIIGGFTEPSGSRQALGALLVGMPDATPASRRKGRPPLRYLGRVGSGLDEASLLTMRQRLDALTVRDMPFVGMTPEGRRGKVHWVEPVLIAEVAHAGLTADGHLRQGSFLGLREDKDIGELHQEQSISIEDLNAPVAGVRISHPERVLFPAEGLRKIDLAHYIEAVGEVFLSHLDGRPLSLVRCQQGISRSCFFQKHVDNPPEGVETVVADAEKPGEPFVIVRSVAGAVALAQLGVLEFHSWGARAPRFTRPDRITLDLDPDPDLPWKTVIEGAQLVRALVEELGLVAFVKTTGGKGLHVVIPLKPQREVNQVKAFSHALAAHLEAVIPQRFTANMAKAKRTGRIFIDYLRNGREATAVAAWSPRAREGAPVSVPIHWDELDPRTDLRNDFFNIRNAPRRAREADPWADYGSRRAALTQRLLGTFGIEPED